MHLDPKKIIATVRILLFSTLQQALMVTSRVKMET